jgi:hypothetical protein
MKTILMIKLAASACLLVGLILLALNTPVQARENGIPQYVAVNDDQTTPMQWWFTVVDSWTYSSPFQWFWTSFWQNILKGPVLIPGELPENGNPPRYCGGDDGFIGYGKQ